MPVEAMSHLTSHTPEHLHIELREFTEEEKHTVLTDPKEQY